MTFCQLLFSVVSLNAENVSYWVTQRTPSFFKRIERFMKIVSIGILIFVFWQIFFNSKINHPAGILISEAPIQSEPKKKDAWNHKHFTIKPLADFKLAARILSRRCYSRDAFSDLMPCDLALGWQSMSDSAVLEHLKLYQTLRYYMYRWENSPPIDPSIISGTSANMHLIPSTEMIQKQIEQFKVGSLIELQGILVSVKGPNGASITSSLSRTDSGPGACEVIWVDSINLAK